MASIDLNIIQRGVTDGFEWSASKGKITAADLGKIGETRTDNSGAMNALPTPFARFFVFKEAFRRVLEEKQNPDDFRKQAGRAYQQLVSNTLDVFELLYNLKWHENQWKSQGRKVIIREWNYEENLPTLKKNVPILGNAVESYFLDDLGTDSQKLFFVFLEDSGKEYLLATSAPMTGFITPPDMDLVATGKGQKEFKFAGECYHFKVMLAAADENVNRAFSTDDVTLDFFVKDDDGSYRNISMADTDDFVCGVRKPVVRSVQSEDVDGGTKYYEVFNTRFDAIEISIDNDGQRASFFLFPKWDKAEPSGKAYTYAVDLGTSNTYVSRREKGKYMEPQQLRMDKPISDSMQAYIKNGQKSLVANIEDSYPRPFSRLIKTEFVPPLIDGMSYAFPIKTSLCIKKDVRKLSLFDNSNIAFFYERLNCPANHTIVADLKWADDEERLRVFVREILLLIKTDILQENGNIAETELIWFRPLSFKKSVRDRFSRIWREEASDEM